MSLDSLAGAVPLHMTVLTNVRVPRHRSAAVVTAVREVAATAAPFVAVVSGRTGFGHETTVQVTAVEMSYQLRRLHFYLLHDVCRAGADPIQPA